MLIEKRFKRSLSQELSDRKKFRFTDAIVIGILAMTCADNSTFPTDIYFIRIFVWGALAGIAYFVVALAFAQLRAKGQPMDHSLKIEEVSIEVIDHLKGTQHVFEWEDFKRVTINDQYFEIRLRAESNAEIYLIKRDRLSPEEDAFLGARLVELS